MLELTIPPGGYTVSNLKSTIAAAKGYIRPYQKDIVIDINAALGQGQTQIPESPKVDCVICHTPVAMDMLQSHDEVCQGGSSTSEMVATLENSDCVELTEENFVEAGFSQLKNMFPNMESNTIKEALTRASGCIEIATEALLDRDGKFTVYSTSNVYLTYLFC